MEKFSVISIAIDAPTFDLFAYYNVKMDILVFLEMGERLYILWSNILAKEVFHESVKSRKNLARISSDPFEKKYSQSPLVRKK